MLWCAIGEARHRIEAGCKRLHVGNVKQSAADWCKIHVVHKEAHGCQTT